MAAALHIGSVRVDPPLALAPMSGYTSLPMRLLCRRAGAGIVYSELLSATGLHYGNGRTAEMMATCAGEHPVGTQIFGTEPDWMAAAAEAAVARGADVVDINMGCAVPKVMKTGAGAALLAEPERAVAIVKAVSQRITQPVTVKIRAGLTEGDRSWLGLAERLVQAGAAALCLHARTARQRFEGRADWAAIAALVREVPVPVIGNGDVDSPRAARRMREETGCAAVMIGRAALGNPWIFAQAAAELRGDVPPRDPTPRERVAVALCHLGMLAAAQEERRAVLEMRPVLAKYLQGLSGARRLRAEIMRATTVRQVRDLLLGFARGLEWIPDSEEAGDHAAHPERQPGLVEAG